MSEGWYPYGVAGQQAQWDGRVWTSQVRPDPTVAAPPPWHRNPLRFLGHLWFWVFLGFWAATALLGLAVNSINHSGLAWAAVFYFFYIYNIISS